MSLIKRAITGQDFWLGSVHPRSKFLSIPKLTPSREVKFFRTSPNRDRISNSDLPGGFAFN